LHQAKRGEKCLTSCSQKKEWRHQLRSSLHPALFAAAYLAADALAAALGLSPALRARVLLAAPKALQAVVAACVDLSTLALAENLYGADDPATWFAVGFSSLRPAESV
jgi:phosphatidylinositol glycan class B